MRIVCDRCAAAFAIDDRVVTAAGVRAQCPRCRNLQLVKRGEDAAASPPAAQAEAPAAPEAPRCPECGEALEDPFDVAIGVCEGCRSKTAEVLAEASAAPRATAPSPPSAAPDSPPKAPRARFDRRKVVAIGGLALSVGVIAALALTRPWVDKTPVLATSTEALPIQQVVARWKLQHLDVSGSAAEHLKAGEEKLALDTTSGYLEAEEEFQKALVLDPRADRAVAGYVQALALGRGPRLDEATRREALGLITTAERRSGDQPLVLIAHANLLLIGKEDRSADARALAELATVSPDATERALAYLAIGQSHLATNVLWAAESFEKAVANDPALKRTYLFRARALAAGGELKKAVESLEKRLQLDPDQWEAADALGRLYVDLGEPSLARATYEKARAAAPRSPLPRLALAVLAYQHENRVAQAIEALSELANPDRFDQPEVLEALGHLSAAHRLLGRLEAAAEHANRALALADDAAARLQLFLLALQRKDAAQARAQFTRLAGRLGDAALEKLLEGRLLLVEGQPGRAMEAFAKAAELDPRRTDALLQAGAAAARSKSEKAYEFVLQRALRADPGAAGPRQTMTRLYLQPGDTLRGAEGHFSQLSRGADDPNPPLCEGLVHWHLGDLAAAERHFGRAVAIDPSNAWGHAYRALIQLKRGDLRAAKQSAARAVEWGRPLALTHYAQGMALLAGKEAEAARLAFKEAHARDPGLLSARVRLGALQLSVGQESEGRKMLTSVLDRDPHYLDAKRALYTSAK